MISCDICKDLMPVCAAGECNEISKREVDEHIKTCDSCRQTWTSMSESILPSEEGTGGKRGEAQKEITFKKGFRKIRRRWILSIVCILLLFPISGLGILGYNEYKGEGLAYTNLDEVISIRSFMECLKNKDYEGAFSYLDVEGMYESVTTTEDYGEYGIDFASFYTAVIGGKTFYVQQPIDLSLYSNYSQEGMDTNIWADIIQYNAKLHYQTPIPEASFEAAAELAEALSGEEVIVIEPDSEIPNGDYTYMKYTAVDQETYYIPTKNGRAVGPEWGYQTNLIPEAIYRLLVSDMENRREKTTEKVNSYRELGLEKYTELVKDEFIQTFQALEASGITAYDYNIGSPVKENFLLSEPSLPAHNEDWYFSVKIRLSTDTSLPMEECMLGFRDGKVYLKGTTHQSESPADHNRYITNILPYSYIFDDQFDQVGQYSVYSW